MVCQKAEIYQILLHSCIALKMDNLLRLLFLKRIGNIGEGTLFLWILPSVSQPSTKFPISLANFAQFWFLPFVPPSRTDSELFIK